MNCSVSAGPTIDLPLFQLTGPTMCGWLMPMWPSVPAIVAAPISCSASIMSFGGRLMPGVCVMADLQLAGMALPVGDGTVGAREVRSLPELEALLVDERL